jgi:nitrate reductase NapE component
MDKKLKSECIALILLIIAFPIVSAGSMSGSGLVWWIGLISLIAGGLLPIWTRYMDHSRDEIRDAGFEFDDRTS